MVPISADHCGPIVAPLLREEDSCPHATSVNVGIRAGSAANRQLHVLLLISSLFEEREQFGIHHVVMRREQAMREAGIDF